MTEAYPIPFALAQSLKISGRAPRRLKKASPHFRWITPIVPE